MESMNLSLHCMYEQNTFRVMLFLFPLAIFWSTSDKAPPFRPCSCSCHILLFPDTSSGWPVNPISLPFTEHSSMVPTPSEFFRISSSNQNLSPSVTANYTSAKTAASSGLILMDIIKRLCLQLLIVTNIPSLKLQWESSSSIGLISKYTLGSFIFDYAYITTSCQWIPDWCLSFDLFIDQREYYYRNFDVSFQFYCC